MDSGSRFEPALRSRLARQARRIEENTARHHTILQGVNASSRTTAGCFDLVSGNSVVAFTVGHDVTVHRIQVAVTHAVIRSRVLIAVESDRRTYVQNSTFEYRRRIHCAFLNHVMGE